MAVLFHFLKQFQFIFFRILLFVSDSKQGVSKSITHYGMIPVRLIFVRIFYFSGSSGCLRKFFRSWQIFIKQLRVVFMGIIQFPQFCQQVIKIMSYFLCAFRINLQKFKKWKNSKVLSGIYKD